MEFLGAQLSLILSGITTDTGTTVALDVSYHKPQLLLLQMLPTIHVEQHQVQMYWEGSVYFPSSTTARCTKSALIYTIMEYRGVQRSLTLMASTLMVNGETVLRNAQVKDLISTKSVKVFHALR